MSRRITLITCSYAGDLARFALQRESIERCGIDLPQVAFINHEDLPLFKQLPHRRNLTLVSTREVLPRRLEQRRLTPRRRRRHPLHWLGLQPLAGWWVQQLAKLAAPAFVDTEAIVCLDSDTCFVRRVAAEDFHSPEGRLHLYETSDGLTVTTCVWLGRCMEFLGVTTDLPVRQYIHNPVPMQVEVLKSLHRHIENRHGRPWMTAMLRGNVTEYCTYGVYARHVNQLRKLEPARPKLSVSYWFPKDVVDFDADFQRRVIHAGVKMVGIQSHTGLKIEQYRPLIERAWAARFLEARDGQEAA